MKKISAILFFSITLLFSSATMAQNSPWVGDWKLYKSDTPTEMSHSNYGVLHIGNLDDGGGIKLTTTEKGEVLIPSSYSINDTGTIHLEFSPEGAAQFLIFLKFEEYSNDHSEVDGTWSEFYKDPYSINGSKLEKDSDDSDGDLAQSSNPWDGQFNLDFKNIDDKETNFVATLNVDYVNGKLEGYIIYFYQDDKREEVVIEHFNDSDTELILGFKVEGSDALFFPLTLRIEDDGSISGSWEDKEESYTIEGFRIAPI